MQELEPQRVFCQKLLELDEERARVQLSRDRADASNLELHSILTEQVGLLQSLAACKDAAAIQALLPSVRALLRGGEASSDDGGPAETGPSVARALLDELARLLDKGIVHYKHCDSNFLLNKTKYLASSYYI